ncbi:ACT domain-containing protein [Arthrobacter sp. D3-16]
MTGEKNLQALLTGMRPVRRPGEYVYVLWPHGRPLAAGIEAAVREAEGLTVVLPRAEADSEGLPYDFVDHPADPLGTGGRGINRGRQQGPHGCGDQLQCTGRVPP